MAGREPTACLGMTGVLPGSWTRIFAAGVCVWASVAAEEDASKAATAEFESRIKPLLEHYCFDCHGDGSRKGEISLDDPEKGAHKLDNHGLWLQVWKNLRTDLMPPAKKDQPTADERAELIAWIERKVFGLDPANPDPGRVTLRRLNRVEYGHSIEDILGVKFNVNDAFPPDDTGYGFDTIGDVLSISPLLMEKYLAVAERIMAQAIPLEADRAQAMNIDPGQMRNEKNGSRSARFMRAGSAHRAGIVWDAKTAGRHRLAISYQVVTQSGGKDANAIWRVLIDDRELASRPISFENSRTQSFELELSPVLEKGPRRLEFEMVPGKGATSANVPLAVKVLSVVMTGPADAMAWDSYPESVRRIIDGGPPPKEAAEREQYARKILRRLATRAYRQPVEEETLDRLIALAKVKWEAEGQFVAGIRFALTAVLSSPDFLLRGELPGKGEGEVRAVPLDEYALATRLSYFLWSSAPDQALLDEAGAGKLRTNLRANVDRMLADPKAERFMRNFVGQWLQIRELDGRIFDTPLLLGIKDGNRARQIFNLYTRQDMMRETQLFFAHILEENRLAVELITADYAFLNDRLATFYGVAGIQGKEFRKVSLEGNSRQGGLLTQGSFLLTTSNPDRTSPVKRGLYVLDNLLGVPPPPPPPNIPALEDARETLGKDATVEELMEHHRSQPLCHSCHARLDPIGLALERYNALGQWREGEKLETSGALVTGEKFVGVGGLREVLAGPRRVDFHRCFTEKLLTYAVGRGVEYYDAPAVDGIIKQAETAGGGLREFLYGVVESVPFQMKRAE
jgi:mono/diheme cytochrome c family protein